MYTCDCPGGEGIDYTPTCFKLWKTETAVRQTAYLAGKRMLHSALKESTCMKINSFLLSSACDFDDVVLTFSFTDDCLFSNSSLF